MQLQKLLVLKIQEKFALTVRGLKGAFALYDKDGNGLLDLEELKQGIAKILNGVSDDEITALITAYDLNGDGKLSYEEFLAILINPSIIEKAGSGPRSGFGSVSGMNYNSSPAPAAPHKQSAAAAARDRDRVDRVPDTASRWKAPSAPAPAPGPGRIASRPRSAAESSVFSFNETHSTTESAIDLSSPAELEARARAYLNSLRSYLLEQAGKLRQQGMAGKLQERLVQHGSDLLDGIARSLLEKAFQPFTGSNDGRARGRKASEGKSVDLTEFTKVLRGFPIVGASGPAAVRIEVVRFLFSLCCPQEGGSALTADPDLLMSLLFGNAQPSSNKPVPPSQRNIAAGVSTIGREDGGAVGALGLSAVDKADRGKALIGTGPVRRASGKDAETDGVPLRFTTTRAKTSFPVPTSFDSEKGQIRSSREPSYDLHKQHVHGLSSKLHSGSAVHALLPAACANPTGHRNDPDYLDASVIVYASAAVGVVHDMSTNTQKIFGGHEHDITCMSLSNCGRYVATGSSGARTSCIHVWESRPTDQFGYTGRDPTSLAQVGLGFFDRAVCAVAFLADPNFVCGIGCDDAHTMGVWDIRSPSSAYLVAATTQNGIPPQVKGMKWAPHQEYTEYITKSNRGLCDVGCTAGEHHLKLWSFRRPTVDALGTQEEAQLGSRGAIFGEAFSKKVQPPKVYTCVDFAPCADKTSDVVAGGSNGIVYLFRKGQCIEFANAIRGGVRCLQVAGDMVCCGGKGGTVVCLNVRTLASIYSFRAAYPAPAPAPGASEGYVQASGRAVSAVARPLSAASGSGSATARGRSAGASAGSMQSDDDLGELVGLAAILGPRGAPTHLIVVSTSGRAMKVDLSGAAASAGKRPASAGAGGAASELATGGSSMPSAGVSTLFYFHTGELWGLASGSCYSHHGSTFPQISRKLALLATVGDDRRLLVWDPSKRCTVARASLPAAARSVSFDPTAQFIAVGTMTGSVHVFSLNPAEDSSSGAGAGAGTGATAKAAAATGKGSAMAASTRSAQVEMQHRRSKRLALREVAFRRDFRESVTDVKFSPDGTKIAAGSNDDTICVYGCEFAKSGAGAGAGAGAGHASACVLQPIHRLRGHSSYITHLDWSRDAQLLRSTCGAYELLYWNVASGKQFVGSTVDVAFSTETCPLGFPVMGIWPPCSDGTDINAVDVGSFVGSSSGSDEGGKLVFTGDDSALVSVMNYPCVVRHAPRKTYRGHGSHVTNVRFFKTYASRESEGEARLATVGGRDATLITWALLPTPASSPVRKYVHKLD